MPPKKTKPKTKPSKKTVPEDYELSDSHEQPTYITLTEEQKLTSKNINIQCPACNAILFIKNDKNINPQKGITCRCNPFTFKLSKTDKSINVPRDVTGEIELDCQDRSISRSFNRIIRPESDEERKRYEMFSDVMNTPRNKPSSSIDGMD